MHAFSFSQKVRYCAQDSLPTENNWQYLTLAIDSAFAGTFMAYIPYSLQQWGVLFSEKETQFVLKLYDYDIDSLNHFSTSVLGSGVVAKIDRNFSIILSEPLQRSLAKSFEIMQNSKPTFAFIQALKLGIGEIVIYRDKDLKGRPTLVIGCANSVEARNLIQQLELFVSKGHHFQEKSEDTLIYLHSRLNEEGDCCLPRNPASLRLMELLGFNEPYGSNAWDLMRFPEHGCKYLRSRYRISPPEGLAQDQGILISARIAESQAHWQYLEASLQWQGLKPAAISESMISSLQKTKFQYDKARCELIKLLPVYPCTHQNLILEKRDSASAFQKKEFYCQDCYSFLDIKPGAILLNRSFPSIFPNPPAASLFAMAASANEDPPAAEASDRDKFLREKLHASLPYDLFCADSCVRLHFQRGTRDEALQAGRAAAKILEDLGIIEWTTQKGLIQGPDLMTSVYAIHLDVASQKSLAVQAEEAAYQSVMGHDVLTRIQEKNAEIEQGSSFLARNARLSQITLDYALSDILEKYPYTIVAGNIEFRGSSANALLQFHKRDPFSIKSFFQFHLGGEVDDFTWLRLPGHTDESPDFRVEIDLSFQRILVAKQFDSIFIVLRQLLKAYIPSTISLSNTNCCMSLQFHRNTQAEADKVGEEAKTFLESLGVIDAQPKKGLFQKAHFFRASLPPSSGIDCMYEIELDYKSQEHLYRLYKKSVPASAAGPLPGFELVEIDEGNNPETFMSSVLSLN